MVLFDGGGNDAGNADAVAAHERNGRAAVFELDFQPHRFRVFFAKLEDVADFDAAADGERAAAVRGGVAFDDVAQVGDFAKRYVALPVDVEVVVVVFVGARGKVGDVSGGVINDDRYVCANRTQRACARAHRGADFRFFCHAQGHGNFRQVFGLDGVQFVVATDDEGDNTAFGAGNHQGFDGALNRHVVFFNERGDGFAVWCRAFFHRSRRRGARRSRAQRFGFFEVGRVAAAAGEDDGVFAGRRQHVEFVRAGTADGAVIGQHRAVIKAEAVEDAAVGVVHVLIGRLQARFVKVEGVGVFHQEFASAHHAKARPDFVAEFGLDLIDVQRQLFVAGQIATHQVGDDFFMRRPQAVFALVPVKEAQQFGAIVLPAPGFLPEFARLHPRHEQLE